MTKEEYDNTCSSILSLINSIEIAIEKNAEYRYGHEGMHYTDQTLRDLSGTLSLARGLLSEINKVQWVVVDADTQTILKEKNESIIDHPSHYNWIEGVECIDVAENFPFNVGNAIKYIWRSERKTDKRENIGKAIWYLQREIERMEKNG